MTKAEWIEKNRDALEKTYHDMYQMSVVDNFDNMWSAFKTFEKSLIEMGILEADPEEPDEEPDDGDSWAAWALDHKIDMEREERIW